MASVDTSGPNNHITHQTESVKESTQQFDIQKASDEDVIEHGIKYYKRDVLQYIAFRHQIMEPLQAFFRSVWNEAPTQATKFWLVVGALLFACDFASVLTCYPPKLFVDKLCCIHVNASNLETTQCDRSQDFLWCFEEFRSDWKRAHPMLADFQVVILLTTICSCLITAIAWGLLNQLKARSPARKMSFLRQTMRVFAAIVFFVLYLNGKFDVGADNFEYVHRLCPSRLPKYGYYACTYTDSDLKKQGFALVSFTLASFMQLPFVAFIVGYGCYLCFLHVFWCFVVSMKEPTPVLPIPSELINSPNRPGQAWRT